MSVKYRIHNKQNIWRQSMHLASKHRFKERKKKRNAVDKD